MRDNKEIQDVSDSITHYRYRMDFDSARRQQLPILSSDIFNVFILILLPVAGIHFFATLFIITRDFYFKQLSVLEKIVSLLCNFLLVLPHSKLDQRYNRLLLLLHSFENLLLMLITKFYFFDFDLTKIFSFPLLYYDFCFIIPVFICNAISIVMNEFFFAYFVPWNLLLHCESETPTEFPSFAVKVWS